MASTLDEETFDQPGPRISVAEIDRQQAILTDYYMLTDPSGGPAASLLLLLDRQRNPVRAELHLYADATDEAREYAFRQGRTLMERRYASAELVPLQILESQPLGDTIQVRTMGSGALAAATPWRPNSQLLAGVGLLALLLLLGWGLWRWVGGSSPTTGDEAGTISVTPASENGAAANQAPAQNGQSLPPSNLADPNLAIGKRIRVRPNLKVSLVAEPNPDQAVVGYLQNQQEAAIVDGPVLTQGKSDTIVWWRIRLDDGAEAWAPANTSDVTLLELVE